MPQSNHYGIHLDSEVPTTGVFSNNSLDHIWDDAYNGIDPDYEAAEKEWHLQAEAEDVECLDRFAFSDMYEQTSWLIGFRKGEDGKYEADPDAEYSAIISLDPMPITQVVASKWRIRGALCSPCCPGQVDADTPGEFLAFSVPPDLIDAEFDAELRARIFAAEVQ